MEEQTRLIKVTRSADKKKTRLSGLQSAKVMIPSLAAGALFSSFKPISSLISDELKEDAAMPEATAATVVSPENKPNSSHHTTSAQPTHEPVTALQEDEPAEVPVEGGYSSNGSEHTFVDVPSDSFVEEDFDDLPFEQAFARAQESAGPGKIFVYQGIPMLTSTQEDVEQMSDEEIDALLDSINQQSEDRFDFEDKVDDIDESEINNSTTLSSGNSDQPAGFDATGIEDVYEEELVDTHTGTEVEDYAMEEIGEVDMDGITEQPYTALADDDTEETVG